MAATELVEAIGPGICRPVTDEEKETGLRYGMRLYPYAITYEGTGIPTPFPPRVKRAEFAYVALARLGVDISDFGTLKLEDLERTYFHIGLTEDAARAKFTTPNGCTLRVEEFESSGLALKLDAEAKVYRPYRAREPSSYITLKLRDWSIEPSGLPERVEGVDPMWTVNLPRNCNTHEFFPDTFDAEGGLHHGVGPAKILLQRAGLLPAQ